MRAAGSRWLPCPLYHTTLVKPRPAILWHLLTRPRHFAAPQTGPKPSGSAGCLDDWRARASISGGERGLHLLTLLRFLPRLYDCVTSDMGLQSVIVDHFLGSRLERLSVERKKLSDGFQLVRAPTRRLLRASSLTNILTVGSMGFSPD